MINFLKIRATAHPLRSKFSRHLADATAILLTLSTQNMNSDSTPKLHFHERMSAKLAWFRDSNAARRAWVEEGLTRIDEGDFHPEWRRLIEAVEVDSA